MNTDKFAELYYACFDKQDNITLCGRDKCRELLYFLKDPMYGDIDTGRLNLAAVVALKNELLGGDHT